mgnify:CR=1 FL=1|tara:strand:+ start:1102 stop:1437 length:336 start_codon:yes stop_codon:yes gene_type:complete
MAIPSGFGTEVLKRTLVETNNGAWTNVITGVADHIYTVLNIVAANQSGSDTETIYIKLGAVYLLTMELGPTETFIWNDRIVVSGAENLLIYNSAGDVDWLCNYIDQDWDSS